MTEKELTLITETATRITLEEHKRLAELEREEFADKRLHNTKLLLKNYRYLKLHCENAVYDSAQAMIEAKDVIRELMSLRDSSSVTAIVNSMQKTQTLLSHVDMCLALYKTHCFSYGGESDQRQWRVIHALYLSKAKRTVEEIAEKEAVEPRTIYKDINKAVEALSALLFGAFF